MRINTISFAGVKTVSIAQCSYNELDDGQENDSTQKAEEILKKEDERLTAENIPHSTFTIVNTDRFHKEVKELNQRLGQHEEMLPPSDYYDRPLIDVHYNIATGQEHEGLKKIDGMIEWFSDFKPNLKEKDTRGLKYGFEAGSAVEKMKEFKEKFIYFLDRYGNRED